MADVPTTPPGLTPGPVPVTVRQQRAVNLLTEKSPELAESFAYALELLHTRKPPTVWLRHLGHSCRELMNRLPDYFPDVPTSGGTVQYHSIVNPLAAALRDHDWDGDEPLPEAAADGLRKLVDEHDSGAARKAARDEAFLNYSARGGRAPTPDDIEQLRKRWKAVHGVFVSLTHIGANPRDADKGAARAAEALAELEHLLLSRLLEVPYHELDQHVRELALNPAPTLLDLGVAQTLLREELRPAFFHTATAAWLPLLADDGWFDSPPPPELGDDWVSFPDWPQAQYLTRVAGDYPDDVLRIIDSADKTDNQRVKSEFLQALINLPDAYAGAAVERAARWLDEEHAHHLLVPAHAEDLLRHLIARGLPEALPFTEGLLATRIKADDWGDVEGFGRWVHTEHEGARLDKHHYEEVLRREVPELAARWPLQTAQLLIDRLSEAARQEADAQGSSEESSSAWRRTIEPHAERFAGGGLQGWLLSALRDLGEELLKSDPALARRLLASLAEQRRGIFTRLRLHLLRVADPDTFGDVRREAVLTRRFLDWAEGWHEYSLLLGHVFPAMSRDDQDIYLAWVADGGSTEYLEAQCHERGEEPSAELRERFLDQWRLQWLSPIKASLADNWVARYDRLVAEFGELEQPEFTQWFRRAGAPLRSADALNAMTVPDAVTFFAGDGDPSNLEPIALDALLEAFEAAVRNEPVQWALRADEFKRALHPAYVHQLLHGLNGALRADRTFEWPAVLDLGVHILAASSRADSLLPVDHDEAAMLLGHARRTLALLLSDALTDEGFPQEQEAVLWAILTELLEDPSPTPTEDADGEPLTIAINSTRGDAMSAVIRLGIRQMERLRQQKPSASLDELPELRGVLESRLDPTQEPSRAVRAIYVRHLPSLYWLDRAWLSRHVAAIFPMTDPQMWTAAWETYVRWTAFHRGVVEMLADHYERAVDDLLANPSLPATSGAALWGRALTDEREHFAEHMYLAAWLALPKLSTAVRRYLAGAPEADRAHGILHLGQLLHDQQHGQDLRDDRAGMERIWRERLDAAVKGDAEMKAFGYWFDSGMFNDANGLQLLSDTLRKANGSIEDIRGILEALEPLASSEPAATLDVIELLAADPADELRWSVEQLKKVLTALLSAGDGDIASRTRKVADHLAWRGFRALGGLA